MVRTSPRSHHLLTSSMRYQSTDARQNGIYLLNNILSTLQQNVCSKFRGNIKLIASVFNGVKYLDDNAK